jgi:kinesin family protein C1
LLEAKTAEARRLSQQKYEVDTLQSDLAKATQALVTAAADVERVSQEKRCAEVTLNSWKEHHLMGDQQQLLVIAELQVAVDKLTREVESMKIDLGEKRGSAAELQTYNKSLKQLLVSAETGRISLHNQLQELKGNVRVVCRVRPAPEGLPLAVQPQKPNRLSLNHSGETYALNFDKVFGPATPQSEVYSEVAGLVQSALDGYKVCIFAYGQTGSGKTYTMQGTDEPGCSGLIPRSLIAIFQASEEMRPRGWSWTVHASFMEVYNESLRDLLRDPSSGGPLEGHIITQHEAWGTMVTGMTSIEVTSVDQITSLMSRAAKQRSVASTAMNASSSRSHSVFCLYLKGTSALLGTEVHGALHLVDLGGSERLDKSGSTGDRLRETLNINRSLSSLADVFAAKAECSSHVPFRNSKLTHLMEPCLSGQGKTLMLVNLSPEQLHSHETLCSLRFAKQVSQCNMGGKPQRHVKTMRANSLPKQSPERHQDEKPATVRRCAPSPPRSKHSQPKDRRHSVAHLEGTNSSSSSASPRPHQSAASWSTAVGPRRHSMPEFEAVAHVINLW